MSALKHLRVPLGMMLLLPLLAACILCYTFGDGVITDAPFGIVDQDNSSLSRMVSKQIAEDQTFDVKYYSDSVQDLREQIESNQIVAGVIIPKQFSVDVLAGKSPSILVIYDGCQMSVVGISKVKLTEVLTTLKVAASVQILEGKLDLQPHEALLYAQPIRNNFRYLGNPEKSIGNYVLPGSIANIVQLTLYMFMLEAIRKEEQERIHPLLYNLLGSVFSTLILMLCIWVMQHWFGMAMRGSWAAVFWLGVLNMFTVGNFATLARLCLPSKTLSIQMGVIVMATLLFSGYTFPALGMPPFFQAVAALLPFTYYAIPLRNVMLLGSTLHDVWPDISCLLLAVLISTIPVILGWMFYRLHCIRKQSQQMDAPPEDTAAIAKAEPEQEVASL